MRFTCISVLFILLCANLSAQDFPQPKLRYNVGFFSVQYELGDQDVTSAQVLDHLQDTNAEAYYLFRKSQSQSTTGTIFSIVGSAGLLVGLLSKNNTTKIIGYGGALVGSIVSLSFTLSSQANAERAVNTYNAAFGYR